MAFTAANALCCNWLLRYVTCPLLQLLCTHHCLASPSLLLMHLAAALPLLLFVYTKCFMPLPCPRASFCKCCVHSIAVRSLRYLSPALHLTLRCVGFCAATSVSRRLLLSIVSCLLLSSSACIASRLPPFTPYCTMYCMLERGLDCNVMTLYLWHELERSMLDPETSVRNRLAYRRSMTRLSCTMGILGKNQRVR